jgi:hypothetical protein
MFMTPPGAQSVPQMPGPIDAVTAAAAGVASRSIAPAQAASDPVALQQQQNFVTYRVFATQYKPLIDGSVEVSVPDQCVKVVVTGRPQGSCPSSYSRGLDYRVLVTLDNGTSMTLPVKEVGPWNLDDNYWDLPNGPRPRRLFTDLPRGKPEAQAAYQDNYNFQTNCKTIDNPPQPYPQQRDDGADQYGRCVLNPSALDISIPAAAQMGFPGSSWVTATFLWEPSTKLSKPAVFRNGTWFFRDVLASGPGQFSFQFGGPGDVPVFGDWNHDGSKTIGVFRPSEGRWYLRNSNSPGAPDAGVFQYGIPTDIPVVGDWNDDGTDTFGVFRAREGRWYLTNHFDSGIAEGVFQYGAPDDIPVVGDWNNDGGDTLGVFRPRVGRWYLTNRLDSGVAEAVFQYGSPGDVPVAADWDGDGTDTFGVFRNGTWYITNRFDTGIAQMNFAFGAPTDTPRAWR